MKSTFLKATLTFSMMVIPQLGFAKELTGALNPTKLASITIENQTDLKISAIDLRPGLYCWMTFAESFGETTTFINSAQIDVTKKSDISNQAQILAALQVNKFTQVSAPKKKDYL